jgi:hypothetical protein
MANFWLKWTLIILINWFALACGVAAIFSIVVTYGKHREQQVRHSKATMHADQGPRRRRLSPADGFGSHVVARTTAESDPVRQTWQSSEQQR